MAPRAALCIMAALSLGACDYARSALDYGRGPFDESARNSSDSVYLGMSESSWDSGRFDAGTLLVTNKRGNDMSIVDLARGREARRVPTCTNPHELAVSPDGRHVAVGCYGGTTVDILATSGFDKLASIELGDNARPHGIFWHESGDIFVTAEGREELVRIRSPLSAQPLTSRFPTGKRGSHMLAIDPDLHWAWTTDLGSRTVTRISLIEGICEADSVPKDVCKARGNGDPLSVTVGEEPEGISLAPDGTALWVSARGSNQAFKLDPLTMEVRATVKTGRFPLRLSIRPQGDVAVTSNLTDGTLSVIDLDRAEVIRTIRVSDPKAAGERFQVTILWAQDGKRIYVAETGSNTVAEVDYYSGTVLRHLRVGNGGDGLAIIPGVSPQ